MGLIKAATGAIGGNLGDQWLDAIGQPEELIKQDTILIKGTSLRADPRSSNTRGTAEIISNGSRIVVPVYTTLLLVDGGKIVDYTTEAGYYTVDDSSAPSLFAGQWGDSFRNVWERFKFAGTTPQQQRAIFVAQREIRDIKFGTKQPIQYFDSFYNAELFLRTFGSFTIRVNNPLLFFANVYDKAAPRVNFSDIQDQFLAEFISKLTTAIVQLSAQGLRISTIQAQQDVLSQTMANLLDSDWSQLRGIEILQVAVESISYTDESRELINLRNKGAMLADPTIRTGFVAGEVAQGIHDAGALGGSGALFGLAATAGAAGGLVGGLIPPAAGPAQPVAPPAPTPPGAAPGVPLAQPWTPPPAAPAVSPYAAPVAPAAAAGAAAGVAAGAAGLVPPAVPATADSAAPPVAPAAAADGAAPVVEGPKFCPNCGTPNAGGRFCANCGTQLR